MTLELKTLPGGVGVEVSGLSVDGPVDSDTARALYQAWLEAGVVVFRGLGTSPEVQLALSRCFGELEPHPIERLRLGGYPDLILLSNKDGLTGPVYYFDDVPIYGRIPWHTDLVYTTTPNAGAVLRMVQPTETGGETGWIDTAMAYDALDDDTKARIDGLEARFHFIGDIGEMRFNHPGGVRRDDPPTEFPHFPDVAHPLVWVHPESGRKALNVSTMNIHSILGMENDEGDALIQQLIDHALKPEFQYIHQWQPDDMVLWDNRRTMHAAMGHPVDEIRIVHRSTIRGTIPMGRVIEETARTGEKA